MIHKLKYNGYEVADRLLEGVIFTISIDAHGREAKIIDVTPDKADRSYLDTVKWEPYVKRIQENVNFALHQMIPFLEKENITFEQEFQNWEKFTNGKEAGVQVVLEYT